MAEDITEFTWLDPTELHLVGAAANDFTPLVAKAATAEEKEGTTMQFTNLAKAEDVLAVVLEPLQRDIERAKKAVKKGEIGAHVELDGARMRMARAKIIIGENARQANPQRHMTKMGPGYTQILVNRHALPDDTGIFGINSRGIPVA
jgi:hypothetical protein